MTARGDVRECPLWRCCVLRMRGTGQRPRVRTFASNDVVCGMIWRMDRGGKPSCFCAGGGSSGKLSSPSCRSPDLTSSTLGLLVSPSLWAYPRLEVARKIRHGVRQRGSVDYGDFSCTVFADCSPPISSCKCSGRRDGEGWEPRGIQGWTWSACLRLKCLPQ